MNKVLKITMTIALFTSFALLGGCGVKGSLERPEGAPKEVAPGPDGKKIHKSTPLDALL